MRYLVGKGTAVGRSGFCTDELDGGLIGPRLVVVPDGDARFAIGKFEISEADLAPFCAQTGRCSDVSSSNQPATGVGLELASAYADWLSQRSGYRYRLPTRAEWERVARAGKPDPNRNCQVRVAGVSRGKETGAGDVGRAERIGLVESVRQRAGMGYGWRRRGRDGRVLRGTRSLPVTSAPRSPKSSAGDRSTGMRLVREVR
jgi:hypothetical protein